MGNRPPLCRLQDAVRSRDDLHRTAPAGAVPVHGRAVQSAGGKPGTQFVQAQGQKIRSNLLLDELDDILFEANEVAKFFLEIEGTTVEIDDEIEIEDKISEIMKKLGDSANQMLNSRRNTAADEDEEDDEEE